MRLSESSGGSKLEEFPNWESIKEKLSRADFARECAIDTDDWTENIVFQLTRHNGTKATPQVYTYHLFEHLSPTQLAGELQEVAAWPLSSPPSPWTQSPSHSPRWAPTNRSFSSRRSSSHARSRLSRGYEEEYH